MRSIGRLGWVGPALLVACGGEPGPLRIRYELTTEAAQRCPSASCADIAITCDAVLQIRVVDPSDPSQAYVSACLPIERPETLCEISREDLPAGLEIPDGTVEVQVAVYPREAATVDDDGVLRCPSEPRFGADGLPMLVDPVPALGGRTFADGDDDEVVVPLGCTDLGQLSAAACTPLDSTIVRAGVTAFETRVGVSPAVASTLTVSVGEPVPRFDPVAMVLRYALDPASATVLAQVASTPIPAWEADVPERFDDVLCTQVLEDAPQATTALACRQVDPAAASASTTGVRVERATVDAVLEALSLGAFPTTGLVLGVVIDYLGAPEAGVRVTPSAGAVQYLDAAGTGLLAGDTTGASGLFVSVDAPFTAAWDVEADTPPVAPPVGGLVNGKLTVVIIELRPPGPL